MPCGLLLKRRTVRPHHPGFEREGKQICQSHGHTTGFFSRISDDPECPKQVLSAYKDIMNMPV